MVVRRKNGSRQGTGDVGNWHPKAERKWLDFVMRRGPILWAARSDLAMTTSVGQRSGIRSERRWKGRYRSTYFGSGQDISKGSGSNLIWHGSTQERSGPTGQRGGRDQSSANGPSVAKFGST